MPLIARTVGESSVKLWGLDARTRLTRALDSLGITLDASNTAAIGAEGVLLIHVGYLFEPRTLKLFSERSSCLLRCPATGAYAAAMASAGNYEELTAALLDPASAPASAVPIVDPSIWQTLMSRCAALNRRCWSRLVATTSTRLRQSFMGMRTKESPIW